MNIIRSSFRYRSLSAVLLLFVSILASQSALAEDAAIPDTPAGKHFTAWLAALNTGRRDALTKFTEEHWTFDKPQFVDENADRDMNLFRETQGLVLRKAEAIEGGIKAIVQSKLTEFWIEIKAYADSKPPHKMVGFGLYFTDPPAELASHERLSDGEIRAKLDGLITRLAGADSFSGTILVAKGDKPFFTRASGLASRAWKIPNRLETQFNLASITKMFTAVAVIQLIEKGKLNYDDKVATVLPDYPNKEVANKVTIRHLLSHMSGLTNSQHSTEKEQSGPPRSPRTVKAFLESFVNEPLNFEPGSKFDYSNNGFTLLGAIIEKISGEDYYDYIRAHVFKPAGMSHSDFYDLDNDPSNLATGYMDGPNRTRLSNIFVVGARGGPAGGAYSTVGDLLKFSIALRSHKLVSQKSLEGAWTPRSGMRNGGRQYGYGFEISNVSVERAVGHTGGWFGITNQFEMYPDLGYTIVILTNIDDEPSSISRKFREWLLQGRM